jgi:hypothetical protein
MKAKALDRWNNEGGAAAMSAKHPKRPRDLNQSAKRMADIATGEVEDDAPAKRADSGAKGGMARASKLTPQERADAARLAAQARRRRKIN